MIPKYQIQHIQTVAVTVNHKEVVVQNHEMAVIHQEVVDMVVNHQQKQAGKYTFFTWFN